MKIKIIGAGFSGLTLAYFFIAQKRNDLQVEVVEKSDLPGGMIQTYQEKGYLYETAANAILCNHELEQLCQEIGISILPHLRSSKNRYIFVDRPRKLPISFFRTLPSLIRFLARYFFYKKSLLPHPLESVADWSLRQFPRTVLNHLIEPALQGIYGTKSDQLSASLIFSRLFQKASSKRPPRPLHRGSVSFERGLGSFLKTLAEYLKKNGVQIRYSSEYTATELQQDLQEKANVILCTHAHHAGKILKSYDTELSKNLCSLKYNDLCSLTAVLCDQKKENSASTLQGFGVLFPRDQKFTALGVLFPHFIFPYRGPKHHETWILPNIVEMDENEILQRVHRDRQRLYRDTPHEISTTHIARWPKAIPNYDMQLEKFLSHFTQPKPVFLHGNYLGEIGLGKILLRSRKLAESIVSDNLITTSSRSTTELSKGKP